MSIAEIFYSLGRGLDLIATARTAFEESREVMSVDDARVIGEKLAAARVASAAAFDALDAKLAEASKR